MNDQPPVTEALSDDEIAMIEEIDTAARVAVQQATAQIQGILMLAIRSRKLEGRWHITEDKRALIKVG